MSVRRLPAYPVVASDLRQRLAKSVKLGFTSSEGLAPGARQVAPGRWVFGTQTAWSVAHHGLTVTCVLADTEPLSRLFGRNGLVCHDASIAVVCEWASQDSSRRGMSSPVLASAAGSDGNEPLSFELLFPAASLRGRVRLSLQLLVGKAGSPGSGEAHLANTAGARLGCISDEYELVFDGDGSLFPIRELNLTAEGPLWRFDGNWEDLTFDDFEAEYVALEVNTAHPSFGELKGAPETPYQTALFREVVASWVALFLWRVKEDAEATALDDEGLGGTSDLWAAIESGTQGVCLPGSIGDAAWAFVGRGALDTASLEALMETSQIWVERRFRGR